jgi:hypothetical protein
MILKSPGIHDLSSFGGHLKVNLETLVDTPVVGVYNFNSKFLINSVSECSERSEEYTEDTDSQCYNNVTPPMFREVVSSIHPDETSSQQKLKIILPIDIPHRFASL